MLILKNLSALFSFSKNQVIDFPGLIRFVFFQGYREFARLAVRHVRADLHIRQHSEKTAPMAKRVPMARHSKFRRYGP
ncbi:MAG: hypothetical protein ABSA70_15200, partial [Terriglobia bacterium]